MFKKVVGTFSIKEEIEEIGYEKHIKTINIDNKLPEKEFEK